MQERIAAELSRIAALGPMLKGTVNEVRRGARKSLPSAWEKFWT
jgi:hypothetical protein